MPKRKKRITKTDIRAIKKEIRSWRKPGYKGKKKKRKK